MNKIALKLIFFLFVSCSPAITEAQTSNIELRSAAFFPSAKRLREIYCDVGTSYQIETSFRYGCWNIWENLDWFSKHGKPVGCHGSTRANIINLSIGIKYPYSFCECFTAYVGIGPSLSRIWIKNRTQCFHEKISKVAIGGVLKTGLYYCIAENLFLDLFVDYLYLPIHFNTWVNVGGVKTGIGIGLRI